MSLINFYELVPKQKELNPNFKTHGINVPFRALCAAPSGSGKSNAIMNLITLFSHTFHEIILCVKSGDEPLYNLLLNKLPHGVILFEAGDVPDIENYSNVDENTGRLKRLDKKQRLMIFDDLINDKTANRKIIEYYIKGRKLGFSLCYIGQSFYQIPKQIRDNSQIFIIGRNLLKRDLRMILSAFPSSFTLDEFEDLYKEWTSEPLDVLLINVEKRYIRRNIIGDKISL